MTATKSKRSVLGFDSSDDEDENKSPVVLTKRARLSKPIFKPPTIETPSEEFPNENEKKPVMFTQSSTKSDEDYLKMAITEDATTVPQRLSREASESIATPDTLTRLKTSLFGQLVPDVVDSSFVSLPILPNRPQKSKGLKMMEKMGFKVGDTLGKDSHNENALLEPILVIPRDNKGGVRLDEKKKENMKSGATEEGEHEFKKWNEGAKKQAKLERTVRRMQKQCFEIEDGDITDIEKIHLKDLNVMWRGYVKSIQAAIKKRRDEKLPVDTNGNKFEEVGDDDKGEEQEDIDDELGMFEGQTLEQKMTVLNAHLRSDHDYCFYCGVKYADQGDLFANCPGSTEEEHL